MDKKTELYKIFKAEKLKPCPICGNGGVIFKWIPSWGEDCDVKIICHCGVSFKYCGLINRSESQEIQDVQREELKYKCIIKWNQRS